MMASHSAGNFAADKIYDQGFMGNGNDLVGEEQ